MGLLDRNRKIVHAPRPTTLHLARPLPARIEQHFLATDITEPAGYLEFTKAAHRVAEAAFGAFDRAGYDSLSRDIEIAAKRIDELSTCLPGLSFGLGLLGQTLGNLDEGSASANRDEAAEVLLLREAIQTARDKQDELARTLLEQIDLARTFLRKLGAGGFLPGAKTVDKSGEHRTVQAKAWSSELNWQLLITDRIFNSGEKGTLVMPGRVFVPNHLLDEITKDMASRGADDFHLCLSKCRVEPTSDSGELIIKAADAVVRPGMRADQRNRAIQEYMHAQGWSPSRGSPCASAIREALRGTTHIRRRDRRSATSQS